jgi:hypothetical protein
MIFLVYIHSGVSSLSSSNTIHIQKLSSNLSYADANGQKGKKKKINSQI